MLLIELHTFHNKALDEKTIIVAQVEQIQMRQDFCKTFIKLTWRGGW